MEATETRWLSREDYDPGAADDALLAAVDRDLPDDPAVTLAKGLADAGVLDAPAQVKALEREVAELRAIVERNHAANEAVLKTLQTSVNLHLPESFAAKLTSDIQVHPHFDAPAIPQAPAVDMEPVAKVLSAWMPVLKALADRSPPAEPQHFVTANFDTDAIAKAVVSNQVDPTVYLKAMEAGQKAFAEMVANALAASAEQTAKMVRKALEKLGEHAERQEAVNKSLAAKLAEPPPEPAPEPRKNKKLTPQYDGSFLIEEVDAT